MDDVSGGRGSSRRLRAGRISGREARSGLIAPLLLALLIPAGPFLSPALAQAPSPEAPEQTTSSPALAEAMANDLGARLFLDRCARCHFTTMDGVRGRDLSAVQGRDRERLTADVRRMAIFAGMLSNEEVEKLTGLLADPAARQRIAAERTRPAPVQAMAAAAGGAALPARPMVAPDSTKVKGAALFALGGAGIAALFLGAFALLYTRRAKGRG